MHSPASFLTAWVVLTTTGLVTSGGAQNNRRIVLEMNQTVTITMNKLWLQQPCKDCVLEMSTAPGFRIVLNFNYSPPAISQSASDDCAYVPHYLLIGNDFTAIGQELLTSYKFCQETMDTEIVSRASYLWLDLNPSPRGTTLLELNITALPEVTCSTEEMRCSPVQCVHRDKVCDGHTDCANGQDEYCYHLSTDKQVEERGADLAEESPLLPPENSTCFMCRDGTCILPHLPRYDSRWGLWLWYLCDGVPHCPDGWDEQSYMCYLTGHFPGQFQAHLFQCEAFDPPATVKRQVRMWSLARCDDRRDCRLVTEEGQDRCERSKGMNTAEVWSELYLNPLALTLVIIFSLIIIVSAFLVFHHMEGGQSAAVRHNRGARQADEKAELQSCLATKAAVVGASLGSFCVINKKGPELLQETAV